MDPAACRTEIATGPLAADLAPLVAEAADAAAAAVLNRRDRTGYIPRRHLVVTLARYPAVDGLMRWVIQFGTMPAAFGGGAADFGFYCLCQTLSRIAGNDVGVLLMVADLNAKKSGVQPQIDNGSIPEAFFTDLVAGEVKISRAEEAGLVPIGADVTPADVGAAR